MKSNVEKDSQYLGIFDNKTELYFAASCGVFLLIGFSINKLIDASQTFSLTSFIIAYIFGGYFITIEAIKKIPKGGFDIDFLMIAAAAGAAYIDSWAEGALLLFLFSLGHALEHYAMDKAKKSIEALNDLSPKTALIKKNGELEEIPIHDLNINDIIVY